MGIVRGTAQGGHKDRAAAEVWKEISGFNQRRNALDLHFAQVMGDWETASNILPWDIKLVTLLCKPNRGPVLALGLLWEPQNMNLGSILGLGCLCRPFPAGFTNLGGGRQPRSIGLPTWTVHVDESRHFR